MTLGERLLTLTIEYKTALDEPNHGDYARPMRAPEVIAAEYEAELRRGLGLEDGYPADADCAVTA